MELSKKAEYMREYRRSNEEARLKKKKEKK